MSTPSNSSNRTPSFPDPRPGRSGTGPIPPVNAETDVRLPYEHDESPDSQHSEPRKVIRQAEHDVKRGLVDTDRGTPMNETYQGTRRTSQTPETSQATATPAANRAPQASQGPAPIKAEQQTLQAARQGRPAEGDERVGEVSPSGAESGGTRTTEGSSYGDFAPAREPGTDPTRTPEFKVDARTGEVDLVPEGRKPSVKK